MRTTWMVGGLTVVLLSTWNVCAEPAKSRITQPEVTVRSGPSSEFYPTSRLRLGDTVYIVREEPGGWLAIVPPPGSFSWIHSSLVEQMGPHALVVLAPEAQIWVGSRLLNTKPTVWRTKVTQGTQLTLIGRAEVAQDGAWLPILPAPAEVRYIPADAVSSRKAVSQAAAAPSEPNQTAATPAAFAAPRPTEKATAPLSSKVGDSVAQPVTPGTIATANNGAASSGSLSAPSGSAASPGPTFPPVQRSRAASEYCYLQDSSYTARLSAPIASAPNAPSPSEQWYELGTLHRTTFSPDGRPLYGLQPLNANKRYIYVTPGPNVSLEQYVEKRVYLCGPMVYRGDLRTYYMTVAQVSPAY